MQCRRTTPSSATAEGGALAAGEVVGGGLGAGGGMVRSSQRDARSSSLQREAV
ncbi:MAG TPA: hypothetical protein VF614_13410 [Chthoniobacteraceae bacterium]